MSDSNELNIPLVEIDSFEKISKVYESKSSQILNVKEKETGRIYAAKVLENKEQRDYSSIKNKFEYNAQILSQLDHPAILHFIGYSKRDFNGEENPVMFSEYAKSGSLQRYFEDIETGMSPPLLNATTKLINIYGIASAMAFIHRELNLLHRNLNPSCILINEYLCPKLTGFEYSCKETTNNDELEWESRYFPPEYWMNKEYTKASDVYSFSLIFYEIMTSEIPFKEYNSIYRLSRKVSRKGIRPEFTKPIPSCYRKLIEDCWAQNPDRRPTFDEIVEVLKTDADFITEDVDKDAYLNYIAIIDQYISESLATRQMLRFEDYFLSIHEMMPVIDVVAESQRAKYFKSLLSSIEETDINKYEKERKIGKGGFGKVYIVHEKANQEIEQNLEPATNNKNKSAAKVSINRVEECSAHNIISISREVNIMSRLAHPSILKFIAYSSIDFKNRPKPVIVTELALGGSLKNILDDANQGHANEKWTDTMKLINIYGIAASMAYLHSKKILHRDLKPDNILLDENLYPKIADFGLSLDLTHDDIKIEREMLGTPAYMSPEIIRSETYTTKGDVYAFALIVYEIISGEKPFESGKACPLSLFYKVLKGERPEISEQIPECYKKLITTCWSQNPNQRPSFEDIAQQLKTDKSFIREKVEEDKYLAYVEDLDESLKSDKTRQKEPSSIIEEEENGQEREEEPSSNSSEEEKENDKEREKEPSSSSDEKEEENDKEREEEPSSSSSEEENANIPVSSQNENVQFGEEEDVSQPATHDEPENPEIISRSVRLDRFQEAENSESDEEDYPDEPSNGKVRLQEDSQSPLTSDNEEADKAPELVQPQDIAEIVVRERNIFLPEPEPEPVSIDINDDEKSEKINDYISSNQPEDLMNYLNDECDNQTVLSVLDNCQGKVSPEFYEALIDKGVSLNNPVAHHKKALSLISEENSDRCSAAKENYKEERDNFERAKKDLSDSRANFNKCRIAYNKANDEEKLEAVKEFNDSHSQYIEAKKNYDKQVSVLNKSIEDYKNSFNPYEEAREHLEKASSQGFNQSYYDLAQLMRNQFKNNEAAFKSASEGAEKGDANSKYLLGDYICHGIGTSEKDRNKGVELMLESGVEEMYQNYPTEIGLYYADQIKEEIEGTGQVTPQKSEVKKNAYNWFKKAYEAEPSKATVNNYGLCFMKGIYVKKNFDKAKKIFEKAAQDGDDNAMYHLAFILQAEEEHDEALSYFKKAALLGNLEAQKQYNFLVSSPDFKGKKSEDDVVIDFQPVEVKERDIKFDVIEEEEENEEERNLNKLRQDIKSANNIEAIKRALTYYKEKDFDLAYELLTLAAETRNPIAEFYLGVMTFRGHGCPKNPEEARAIMESLRDKGVNEAADFIYYNFD